MNDQERQTHSITQNPFKKWYPIIGILLYRLAVKWSSAPPPTQAQARAIVKALKRRKKTVNGSRSTEAARRAVAQAAEDIRTARRLRDARVRDAGSREHEIPLMLRLARFRLNAFRHAFESASYRVDTKPEIVLTDDPENVGVAQSSYLDWEYYSKATKYPKKVVRTTLSIPTAWRRRVQAQGIAHLDGLLTLDAELVDDRPCGCRVFAATWLSQRRGYSLSVVRGFIAFEADASYHAETPEKAIAGLNRKLKSRESDWSKKAPHAYAKLLKLVEKAGPVDVTLDDARAAGACDTGIRQWCSRADLDYGAGRATLRAVFAAYVRNPMPEARAAILYAMRTKRKSREETSD